METSAVAAKRALTPELVSVCPSCNTLAVVSVSPVRCRCGALLVKRPDAAASSDNMAMIADLRTGAIPMTAYQGKEFLVTEPSSLAVLPASGLPAQSRFQAHAADVVDRAFALWSTVAGRNAALTASLLAREADEGEATPAGSTVRRWAAEASWAARADADLLQTSARTVAELRAGWLGALSLAQQTLVAGLVGELDDLPHAGAAQTEIARSWC